MDSATHDLLYQRISELVHDEEKIVTIVSLASELKISKDEALSLLQEFVCTHDKAKFGRLYVTYLLYGSLKDGKGMSFSLVKEDDLETKKCLFDHISSETVYSVQKGKAIDFKMIALTNSSCENGFNLISKNSVKRYIKSKRLPVVQTDTSSKQDVISTQSSSSGSKESLKTNGKLHSSQQNKSKQGGLANFFAKAATITKPQANGKVDEKNANVEASNEKSIKKDDLPITDEKKNSDIEMKASTNEKSESSSDDKTNQNIHVEKSTKDDQVNNKKRKKETKNKGPNKKRKRIQEICDSDSDDIFDDNENDDIIEMSDEEPPPPPPTNPVPVPKNKKRKAVDKTYEDEEGFIVTTTEYIYETASEDEDKEPVMQPKLGDKVLSEKKNEKGKSPPESKPPKGKGKGNKKATANGKQPTLMSFFKKS